MTSDRIPSRKTLVFTAYNRPEYLSDVLESWARVDGLDEWRVEVALEPSDKQEWVLGLFAMFMPGCAVTLNEKREGVLVNPLLALDRAFAGGADYVVLAEDDLLVSTDVLRYQEWAAANAPRDSLAVCSFTKEDGPADEVIAAQTFSPWIWGTWSQRWPLIAKTWDTDYSSGGPETSGWDWNLTLRVLPTYGMRCVFPRSSRSQNIGQHNGTHAKPEEFPGSVSPSFVQDRPVGEFRRLF